MTRWQEALLISSGATVAVVPLVRRVALMTGFLDHPAPHKMHRSPTPYLGGAAICVGVLVAVLSLRTTAHSGVIGAAAALLFVVGLVDDRWGMRPVVKLGLQALAAVVVFAVGFHLQAEGVWLGITPNRTFGLVCTFGLFILMPNSVNLLDNTDGCAAGVVAASASCVLAEALVRHQGEFAVAAAAVTGALLGFLVYNRRPASIFMGDAGSLPLGLVLAVMAVRAGGGVRAPVAAEVSLLFLAVPLADTSTVLVARLLHGRSIFQGGQDHLSHRLAASGISIGYATWLLVAAQAATGATAVAVSVGALAPGLGLVLGAVLLGLVVVPAARPTVNRLVYRPASRELASGLASRLASSDAGS
jgi:UDP-GlcNAc:undecaprenyl-phosphate GlcNAc-1-phosphate transferase